MCVFMWVCMYCVRDVCRYHCDAAFRHLRAHTHALIHTRPNALTHLRVVKYGAPQTQGGDPKSLLFAVDCTRWAGCLLPLLLEPVGCRE
jgi:hypothetical protein